MNKLIMEYEDHIREMVAATIHALPDEELQNIQQVTTKYLMGLLTSKQYTDQLWIDGRPQWGVWSSICRCMDLIRLVLAKESIRYEVNTQLLRKSCPYQNFCNTVISYLNNRYPEMQNTHTDK